MMILASLLWLALQIAPRQPVSFPVPSATPEKISEAQDFPYLPPLASAKLIQTSRVSSPLELRSATANDEAVLAGMTYVKKSYRISNTISSLRFVNTYRDALFAAGWKVLDVTRLDAASQVPETVTVSAQFINGTRNIYARITLEPDGPYEINVADVGAEDWSATLARECRLKIPSLHFDLDRPTLRIFESMPTLEKLATVLKSKTAPAVEIQGHMDNIGEAGVLSRQGLSEGRAKVVAAWLISHGVAPAKVTAKGYGKTRPLADNDSDLGRALNRRIEVACLRR